jgi:coproporphyrinogen III oxidase
MSEEERTKIVDNWFEGIKEKIVKHSTQVSITTDRNQPEIRNGLGQVVVIRPETISESVTIDISYV